MCFHCTKHVMYIVEGRGLKTEEDWMKNVWPGVCRLCGLEQVAIRVR